MRSCISLSVAIASLASHVSGNNEVSFRRQLEDEKRHSDALMYKNVDLSKTYTRHSSRGVFCTPDSDGYFGSTVGFNIPVEFAFAVEYAPDADINAIFYQIDLFIEDTILGGFFPKECKYSTKQALKSRNLSDRPINGFHFIAEFQEMAVTCDAKLANATCKIYEGVLLAYGAAEMLDEANVKMVYDSLQVAFDDEIATTIHEKLYDIYWVDVQSMENLAEPVSPGNSQTTLPSSNTVDTGSVARKSGMNAIAVMGIVISTIALIIGVGGMAYVEKRRRQGNVGDILNRDIHVVTNSEIDAPSRGLETDTPNFVFNEH